MDINTINIPDNEIEVVDCPWCFSSQKKVYKKIKNLGLQKCKSCGLVYTSPRVKEIYIGKYYGIDYISNQSNASVTDKHKPFYIKQLQKIKSYTSSCDLLEIGSGGGSFANTAKEMGFNVHVQDICEENIDFIHKKYGIDGYCGKLENLDIRSNSYDVIVMHHVLEHVYDIHLFMKMVYRLLRDNGILVVLLPYPFSIDCALDKKLYFKLLSLPYHTIHLNKKRAKKIFRENNLSVILEEHSMSKMSALPLKPLRYLRSKLRLNHSNNEKIKTGTIFFDNDINVSVNQNNKMRSGYFHHLKSQINYVLSNIMTGEQLGYYLRKK